MASFNVRVEKSFLELNVAPLNALALGVRVNVWFLAEHGKAGAFKIIEEVGRLYVCVSREAVRLE
jgi:hypothetical protein